MVQIAGIDHEVSPLEILWAQGDPQEKALLAVNYVVELLKISEGNQASIEMKDDTKYTLKLEISRPDNEKAN